MTSYPPALFSYSVTPNAVPYTDDPSAPSAVGLMIAVNNGTGQNVDCPRLVFTLPVGSAAGDLTADPSAINAAPALGTPWSITSDKAGSFTALPQAPVTGLNAGDSIAFSLSGIPINQLPGLAEITIYEGANPIRQTQVGVSKVQPGLAITSFSANPIQVGPGQPSTLAWTTTGATSATLSWAGQSVPVSVNGQYSVTPQETTTYTLTASDNSGSTSQQITVIVPRVQILSVGASPEQVALGESSTLTWQVINADICYIEPGHISVDPNSGTYIVNPDQNAMYVLVATGPGGTVTMQFPLEVMAVAIESFTATPNQSSLGLSTTLQWATEWAASCSIDQGVGGVPTSGQVQVTPQQTSTYTLTAQGLNPQQRSVTVTVSPSILGLAFTADPAQPQQVTIWWVVAGASATLEVNPPGVNQPGVSVPLSGSQIVPNGEFFVTLMASASGEATAIGMNIAGAPSESEAQFTSLVLVSIDGITTPGATATVVWKTAQGTVSGHLANNQHTIQLAGANNSVDFGLGELDPNTPGLYLLWYGIIKVVDPSTNAGSTVWWLGASPHPPITAGDTGSIFRQDARPMPPERRA